MKQFLLSVFPNADGTIRLSGKDYHYLVRVRRLKAGSVFSALLPNGKKSEVTILSVDGDVVLGQCIYNAAQPDVKCCPPLILFQGLPRSSRMDLIVRQSAELGLAVVAPFISEYSTAKSEKTGRWERIIKEARQQSGSLVPTAIRLPCSFDGIINYWQELRKEQPLTAGILLHQEPLAEGTFHSYLYKDPPQVVLAVGPEGGFSTAEANRFMAEGFLPIVTGSTILRTETAALYGAAVVQTILLESEAWKLESRNN